MVGFEPTISCSRSTRSSQTFPHPDNRRASSGIELAIPPWQGDGLPLHHGRLLLAQPNCQRSRAPSENRTHAAALRKRCHSTRPSVLIHSVGSVGIEPTSAGLRDRCITLSATIPFVFCLPVGVEGIEPSAASYKDAALTTELHAVMSEAGGIRTHALRIKSPLCCRYTTTS